MPDIVTSDAAADAGAAPEPASEQAVTEPAKVMRIGSMIKLLLEEVRATTLDEASRERLAEVYERSITELSSALSPDLQEELRSLTLPFEQDETPSEAEIRVAKAQLVGWLEGLFHGIQASLMAQQLAAHQQLQGMRQLPDGFGGQHPPSDPRVDDRAGVDRPGTYL
jgi:Bacterial proteasome activator